jgi:hypothetical protein
MRSLKASGRNWRDHIIDTCYMPDFGWKFKLGDAVANFADFIVCSQYCIVLLDRTIKIAYSFALSIVPYLYADIVESY